MTRLCVRMYKICTQRTVGALRLHKICTQRLWVLQISQIPVCRSLSSRYVRSIHPFRSKILEQTIFRICITSLHQYNFSHPHSLRTFSAMKLQFAILAVALAPAVALKAGSKAETCSADGSCPDGYEPYYPPECRFPKPTPVPGPTSSPTLPPTLPPMPPPTPSPNLTPCSLGVSPSLCDFNRRHSIKHSHLFLSLVLPVLLETVSIAALISQVPTGASNPQFIRPRSATMEQSHSL
jgi:hypothetical protein